LIKKLIMTLDLLFGVMINFYSQNFDINREYGQFSPNSRHGFIE